MNNVAPGGHPAPGIIPRAPTEPPHNSLDDFKAAIRTNVADFHQARALERSVFRRFALATLLITTCISRHTHCTITIEPAVP